MTDTLPRKIKNPQEYREVLSMVEKLIDRDPEPDSEEGELLETWAILINDYEQNRFPIKNPDPVEAIKFRMEQMNLTNRDLIRMVGSKTSVSEILNRKRPLSLRVIRNLYKELHIPLDVCIMDSVSISTTKEKKAFIETRKTAKPKRPSSRS